MADKILYSQAVLTMYDNALESGQQLDTFNEIQADVTEVTPLLPGSKKAFRLGAPASVGEFQTTKTNALFTIPATVTPVNLPLENAAFLPVRGRLPQTIAGVPGVITNPAGTLLFTRTTAGSAVPDVLVGTVIGTNGSAAQANTLLGDTDAGIATRDFSDAPNTFAIGWTTDVDPNGTPPANSSNFGTRRTYSNGYFHPGATFQEWRDDKGKLFRRGADTGTTWGRWKQISEPTLDMSRAVGVYYLAPGASDADIQYCADLGINMSHVFDDEFANLSGMIAWVEKLYGFGIYSAIALRGSSYWTGGIINGTNATNITNTVNTFKGDNRVAVFCQPDETNSIGGFDTPVTLKPALDQFYDLVKAADPKRLVMANFTLSPGQLTGFGAQGGVPRADIYSVDIYPLKEPASTDPFGVGGGFISDGTGWEASRKLFGQMMLSIRDHIGWDKPLRPVLIGSNFTAKPTAAFDIDDHWQVCAEVGATYGVAFYQEATPTNQPASSGFRNQSTAVDWYEPTQRLDQLETAPNFAIRQTKNRLLAKKVRRIAGMVQGGGLPTISVAPKTFVIGKPLPIPIRAGDFRLDYDALPIPWAITPQPAPFFVRNGILRVVADNAAYLLTRKVDSTMPCTGDFEIIARVQIDLAPATGQNILGLWLTAANNAIRHNLELRAATGGFTLYTDQPGVGGITPTAKFCDLRMKFVGANVEYGYRPASETDDLFDDQFQLAWTVARAVTPERITIRINRTAAGAQNFGVIAVRYKQN